MDGGIGPATFAVNLAFDLRIATEEITFFHPNLKLGIPPFPPLTYYLVESLGHHKAIELLLTKPELTAEEALASGAV